MFVNYETKLVNCERRIERKANIYLKYKYNHLFCVH